MDRPDVLRFGTFDALGRAAALGPQAARAAAGVRSALSAGEPAGDVVMREEIRQSLWPADTFVDFDAAVNGCISQIRGAPADKATAPRFIETLARRGYRFMAAVQTVTAVATEARPSTTDVPDDPIDTASPAGARSLRPRVVAFATAASLLSAVAVLALAARTASSAGDLTVSFSIAAIQKYDRGEKSDAIGARELECNHLQLWKSPVRNADPTFVVKVEHQLQGGATGGLPDLVVDKRPVQDPLRPEGNRPFVIRRDFLDCDTLTYRFGSVHTEQSLLRSEVPVALLVPLVAPWLHASEIATVRQFHDVGKKS
jgi:DNA-binding winged helix-turn-helix (wHTH) protein